LSAFWIVVGLALTWRMIVVLRRRSRRDWEQMIGASRLRRHPRRHRRPGDARRRRIAAGQTGELLQALAAGQHDPSAHLEAGVVLEPGEVSWGRGEARLWVWSSESAWAWRSRASWWGRRAHGAGREAVVSGWRDHGDIDWLITSARLVGRATGSGPVSERRLHGEILDGPGYVTPARARPPTTVKHQPSQWRSPNNWAVTEPGALHVGR